MAILLVLLALAFPIHSAVRERTRSVQCLNNLRQLGAASLAFSADNNNALLPYALRQPFVTSKYVNYFWYAILYHYLTPAAPFKDFYTSIRDPQLPPFYCPSSGKLYAINRACGWSNPSDPKNNTLHAYLRMGQAVAETYQKTDFGTLSAWRPYVLPGGISRTALLADGTGAFTPEVAKAPTSSNTLLFPHRNRMNVVYMDGHVGTVRNPGFEENPDLLEEPEWVHFFTRPPL